jgi:hypothetical protein
LLLGLFRLLRRPTRAAGIRLLGVLAMAGGVLAPAYAGYARLRAENPAFATQTVWFFERERVTALPWDLLARGVPTAVPLAALLVIVAGAGVRALRRSPDASTPGWRHATLWAVLGVVMSLGTIRLPSGGTVPSLQSFVAPWVPSLGVLRRVDRLGAVALVAAALLTGLGFAACARRLGPRLRVIAALVLAGAMYAEYSHGIGLPHEIDAKPLPRWYPLQRAITGNSPVIDVLRRPGGPVVEVPVPPNLPGQFPVIVGNPVAHARAMYRSIFHWRPLLNGYSGFWPDGFPERMRLVYRLPDPAALAALRRETGLEMIIVNLDTPLASARAAWLGVFDAGRRDDLRPVTRDDHLLLFVTGSAP